MGEFYYKGNRIEFFSATLEDLTTGFEVRAFPEGIDFCHSSLKGFACSSRTKPDLSSHNEFPLKSSFFIRHDISFVR